MHKWYIAVPAAVLSVCLLLGGVYVLLQIPDAEDCGCPLSDVRECP